MYLIPPRETKTQIWAQGPEIQDGRRPEERPERIAYWGYTFERPLGDSFETCDSILGRGKPARLAAEWDYTLIWFISAIAILGTV